MQSALQKETAWCIFYFLHKSKRQIEQTENVTLFHPVENTVS